MGKDLNQKLKNFPKLSKLVDVVIGAATGGPGGPPPIAIPAMMIL